MTDVKREQFEWKGDRLVHKPTGAEFRWSYPNSESTDMSVLMRDLGNRLPNGDDYDKHKVTQMAKDLLTEKRGR